MTDTFYFSLLINRAILFLAIINDVSITFISFKKTVLSVPYFSNLMNQFNTLFFE